MLVSVSKKLFIFYILFTRCSSAFISYIFKTKNIEEINLRCRMNIFVKILFYSLCRFLIFLSYFLTLYSFLLDVIFFTVESRLSACHRSVYMTDNRKLKPVDEDCILTEVYCSFVLFIINEDKN